MLDNTNFVYENIHTQRHGFDNVMYYEFIRHDGNGQYSLGVQSRRFMNTEMFVHNPWLENQKMLMVGLLRENVTDLIVYSFRRLNAGERAVHEVVGSSINYGKMAFEVTDQRARFRPEHLFYDRCPSFDQFFTHRAFLTLGQVLGYKLPLSEDERRLKITRPLDDFCNIKGQIIQSIEGMEKHSDRTVFTLSSGIRIVMELLSNSDTVTGEIADMTGDVSDLIGSPILLAEENASPDIDDNDTDSCWVFYKLATAKGRVDIRWKHDDNQDYSSRVRCYGFPALPV